MDNREKPVASGRENTEASSAPPASCSSSIEETATAWFTLADQNLEGPIQTRTYELRESFREAVSDALSRSRSRTR